MQTQEDAYSLMEMDFSKLEERIATGFAAGELAIMCANSNRGKSRIMEYMVAMQQEAQERNSDNVEILKGRSEDMSEMFNYLYGCSKDNIYTLLAVDECTEVCEKPEKPRKDWWNVEAEKKRKKRWVK